MEMRQIGIIGAGNLGARHLQALALAREAWQITVMDVNEEALHKAEGIFRGTDGAEKHEVRFVTAIPCMPKAMDVVVVATGANVRRRVVEELLAHARVTYLVLEKVLFQRLEDYGAVAELLEQRKVQAFVNCPRRMHPVYERIKRKLEDAETMEIHMSGSDWGMGGNGIHLLDLIAYLAGSEKIRLDISGLDSEYSQSKRKGFLEITGTVSGSMGRCRAFSLSSYKKSGIPDLTMIISDTCRIWIGEGSGELEYADAVAGWERRRESFGLPYQSQLTQLVVEELLSGGSCRLTPFEESVRLHLALEEKLIPYFEKQGVEKGLCPIT